MVGVEFSRLGLPKLYDDTMGPKHHITWKSINGRTLGAVAFAWKLKWETCAVPRSAEQCILHIEPDIDVIGKGEGL
jgi:hypothetical protein